MIYLRAGLLIAALGVVTAAVALAAQYIGHIISDHAAAERRWHDLAYIDGDYFQRPDGSIAFVEAQPKKTIYAEIRLLRRRRYRRQRYNARAKRWWWIARHLCGALRRGAERKYGRWHDRLWATYGAVNQ
jgi:hypothetical protein